jgi:hypothetical protein
LLDIFSKLIVVATINSIKSIIIDILKSHSMKLYDINQHLNDQKHKPNSLVENSPLGKE